MDGMESFIESDTVKNRHDSGILSGYHIPVYEYGNDGDDNDNK